MTGLATIEKAHDMALHDRRSAWHSAYAPNEALTRDQLFHELADSSQWPDMARGGVATRRVAPNHSGKNCQLTFLPLRQFTIRYWCVIVLSKQLQGLWQNRIGGTYLPSTCPQSLFIGRTEVNRQQLNAWTAAQKSRFMLKFDIARFYDSIPHSPLLNHLKRSTKVRSEEEETVFGLLPDLLAYRYQDAETGETRICKCGLPIGNTTERFFSNLYLSPLDDYLLDKPHTPSTRRLDDIRVFGNDLDELDIIRDNLSRLAEDLELRVNETKTRVVMHR